MVNPPKTKEEAEKYRYGVWGRKHRYDPSRCAYEVFGRDLFSQCRSKNGKGINGLYCGTHAKMVEKG